MALARRRARPRKGETMKRRWSGRRKEDSKEWVRWSKCLMDHPIFYISFWRFFIIYIWIPKEILNDLCAPCSRFYGYLRSCVLVADCALFVPFWPALSCIRGTALNFVFENILFVSIIGAYHPDSTIGTPKSTGGLKFCSSFVHCRLLEVNCRNIIIQRPS